ncbi:hypothetical protein QJQ45_004548 [Haematococcus lacustris]|nr:hypothetical protein QJQ45_004548 [Haematococcus lacustris]
MKIWRDLSTWAEQWADAHGDPIGVNGVDPHFVLGVPRLFNDRAKKHYQPDLAPEEQEDVVHVVARLAEVSEAEARRELRRFESGTWHPEMTRVANDIMSMAEAGERDGRAVTIIAPASQRLTWWQLLAQPHFPALAKAALRLLSVHVSTCAAERNWSAWGRLFADALRSSMDMATAEKLVFIQTNDELATNSDNFDKYNGDICGTQVGMAQDAGHRNAFIYTKLTHLIDHLPQELWDAFLDDAVQPRVEACSERAVLASLLLGLLVRGLFTIHVADPLGLHDQPVYTDIPVSQAAIPDLSCRNLFLQLCRGPPGNGANTRPNAQVAAIASYSKTIQETKIPNPSRRGCV